MGFFWDWFCICGVGFLWIDWKRGERKLSRSFCKIKHHSFFCSFFFFFFLRGLKGKSKKIIKTKCFCLFYYGYINSWKQEKVQSLNIWISLLIDLNKMKTKDRLWFKRKWTQKKKSELHCWRFLGKCNTKKEKVCLVFEEVQEKKRKLKCF